jgi:hypothetical protein
MEMAACSQVTADGFIFGPNGSGKLYISVYYHRGSGSSHKGCWSDDVPPPLEYEIFCKSDLGKWFDSDGHYWGVHQSGDTVLGTRGERLSKFPANRNAANPWHGYPVSPLIRGDVDAPPDEVVETWIQDGVVNRTFGRKIQRRKV